MELKTGISSAWASRRMLRCRVTSPNCAPSETACRCKTFKSSGRKGMRSDLGQTNKMRGVLAHDIRSRTEIRSSCDSSGMSWVFTESDYKLMKPLIEKDSHTNTRCYACTCNSTDHYSKYPSARVKKYSCQISNQQACDRPYCTVKKWEFC